MEHTTDQDIIADSLQVDKRALAEFAGNNALLLTDYKSLEEFKHVVEINYKEDAPASASGTRNCSEVSLTCRSADKVVNSILKSGIRQSDFWKAKQGNLWDRIMLGFSSPYSIWNRKDLVRAEILSRRRFVMFGEGDIAFYDLAEMMLFNIADDDLLNAPPEHLSEKGYLNTFNHVTAQAFITTIFNEKMADFIADVHERENMPELVSGNFTEKQLTDLSDGAMDNYLDMINNEWGQELGLELRTKYNITRQTNWTPELLADYLNDIQSYHSYTFGIAFRPFLASDEKIIRFASKINSVMNEVSKYRHYYY
jgi:hypothetical protein